MKKERIKERNMYSITTIMCVVSGYHIENVTFEKAVEIGEEVLKQTSIQNAKVVPMIMSYPHNYGAPDGGEVGISIEFETEDLSVIQDIVKISVLLGQIDSAICIKLNNMINKIYFIHNEFNATSGSGYEALKESHVYFIDPQKYAYIDYVVNQCDLYQLSTRIQKIIEEKGYLLSLKLENQEDGCHIGTFQNPYQGQNDSQKLIDTVKAIMEEL